MKNKILIANLIVFLILSFESIYAESTVDIDADKIIFDQNQNKINAEGNVVIKSNGIQIYSDTITYDKNIEKIDATRNVKIKDNFNNTYYTNNLITNNNFTKAKANNVRIRLKDDARIVGKSFSKSNEINIISNGQYTACKEDGYLIDDCPGWKLKAKNVFHDESSKTMHYDHSILYVMNIPVLYSPYFSHPDPSVKKRSGLLAPSFKADNNLGQILSLPYFYNINSNKDFTFTPTFQSSANNYITTEYRHLNKNGRYTLETSMDDNKDKTGSKHYIFADAKLDGPLDQFDLFMQTTNNDTYLRKNQINEIDVLTSGFKISNKFRGNDFLLETKSYKHISITGTNQWEYLYPRLSYNITNLEINNLNANLNIMNQVIRLKSLNKDETFSIASEFNLDKRSIDKNYGLIYENFFDTRIIHHSVEIASTKKNDKQLRIFPQMGTKISYPLKNSSINFSQILKPVFMPIIAPYNNYTNNVEINNSNVFSRNRVTSLSQWESGPRVNYGIEWYGDYKSIYDGSIILGQSIRFNKEKSDTSEEISDLMSSFYFNLNQKSYSNAELIFDKDTYKINNANISSSLSLEKFKVKAEYDYINNQIQKDSEQLGLAVQLNVYENVNFTFSGKRDLHSDFTIGYETGMLYENDCLAVNFKYYRDLTKFKGLEDTKGLSFLITLKPFGSTKKYGKSKIFGPQID